EYSCRERITLTAGARYNHDGVAGEEVSPSFGLVWRLFDRTSLRAVAAHGFRSPQINELYMFPPSNEDLEAERVWNYEMGLRQKIPGGLEMDISVYRMDGENMIELADNPSPPPMMRFANTGDFVFDGMEVSLDGNWRGGFSGNVSWTKLDPGRWTKGRPGTKIDFGLSQHAKRYKVRLSGRYIDDYYAGNDSTDPIPSYMVIDIYGEAIVTGGVSVFAGLNNIGDEEYSIYTDLPGGQAGLYLMPGRTVTAGLKYGY
ncbi:MAG: TonB-dependent receptor, partial [Candidatus Krumholzibacteria bacterium]|nr:TonB-dependent receptor [Candidatus Krumholzibacteria bacterium]